MPLPPAPITPSMNVPVAGNSIYTPEQQQRAADAAQLGARSVSTGYLYGIGNQTAQDQMKSVYNDPNTVKNYNGTISTNGPAITVNPYSSNPYFAKPTDPNTPAGAVTSMPTREQTPPPTPTGNPQQDQANLAAWYNQKESPWQNALDLAEQYRNYNNAYTNYASDQGNWVDSQGNPYNGSQGDDHSVNWSKFTAPSWSGPAAYGLAGIKAGQTYDDQNQAQVVLQRLKQFDPNASLVQVPSPYEGGGAPQWQINFDQSKLPKYANAQADATAGPYGHNHLYNENALAYDPNYGIMTPSKNIQEDKGPAWFNTVGMLAPVALAMMTGGMGALPSLLMKAPQLIGSTVNGGFNPFQWASAALPFIPGINPIVSNIARAGINYVGSQQRGG